MSVFTLTRTYRSISRLREIALILSKHGFHQVLEAAGLGRLLPLSRRFRGRTGRPGDTPVAVQARMALEDLGPTFVKLGQMLSTRPDLVPPEFVEEFRKLQDEVPPFLFAEVRRIVEEEVGGPLEEAFLEVDPEPLAAASIAQVHRARLTDGSRVVLKVQRPGIERTVSHDLATLYLLATLVERYIPESRYLDVRAIVDEFARVVRRELDFFLEASNTERFRHNFEGFEGVVVPAVRWEFTTKRLLVLEAIEGDPLDDPDVLRARGFEPASLARAAAGAFLKQVFLDGLFHGDLHGGNLLVTPDGSVAFLDFGAVGYLSEDAQEGLGQLFMALAGRDYASLAEGYLSMGATNDAVDLRAFQRDLRELIEPYHGRPLKDLRIGEILREASQIALHHRIRVPPDLILLARSTLALEGLTRNLDPEFLILEEATPYARKLLLGRLDPRRQARLALRTARDLRDFVRAVPSQVTRILQRMLEGKFAVDFVHQGYEPMLHELDRSSNRISFSVIIAALIIGSSLIVLAGRGPLVWDFPVFGILGFLLAGVLGFGLAIAILRSGRF
ncbi:MAG: AarF/ABC1/UbiB kinase family protein [Deferrisomatales bacterium]|nr:AarF/ABC1/UbiB kinase family protein [Deferrisomatales bacterium]